MHKRKNDKETVHNNVHNRGMVDTKLSTKNMSRNSIFFKIFGYRVEVSHFATMLKPDGWGLEVIGFMIVIVF